MVNLKLPQKRLFRLNRALFCVCSLSMVLAFPTIVAGQVGQATPQETVEKFCAFEFGGAQDTEERTKLVHFSGAQMHELGKIMYPISPYVFQWDFEPLEVVDSYKLGRISVSGDKATALVTYELVAKRSSWGGKITPVHKEAITTTLALMRYGNTWKVQNPPYPKVSKSFLISSYRASLSLGKSWYQDASREQLLWVKNMIDEILLLEKLK